jgi:glycolate oxidase
MMDAAFIKALETIVGRRYVMTQPDAVISYVFDAGIDRGLPTVVVLPASAQEIAAVVRLCNGRGVDFIPRGAGTGLSGGAVAETGGVVISTARMSRIIEIDAENRLAVVEPGVVNADISAAVRGIGLRYVPDPSSQAACTIGGNIAENSGGLHCLAHGVTTNHILGVQIVTPEGDIEWLGGRIADTPGYDLLGVFVGSEGTLGIATQAVVRLTPVPERVRTLLAVFETVDAATHAVSGIIARGIVPGALEMMDRLATRTVEEFVGAGLPTDAAAVLIIDVEGLSDGLDDDAEAVTAICLACGAREVRAAKDDAQREAFWKGRKSAFGAMGRISADYYVQDGVIPRSKLPEVLREVEEIGARYRLRIANVFHAGDGNLHPLILFDAKIPGELDRAIAAGADILRTCIAHGGSISGEHGIGIEKRDCMPLQFTEDDLAMMARLKVAFNPDGLCNPGKMFPTSRRCGEAARSVSAGSIPAAVAAAAGPPF